MPTVELTADQILGLDDAHLIAVAEHRLDAHTAYAFENLQQAASQAGFNLQIASSYRNFDRQLWIWNQKATGKRPVLDIHSQPIDIHQFTEQQLVFEILNWSTPPGTSRHHWGTDLDIFDADQIAIDDLRLVPAEYHEGGPCHALYTWLQAHAATLPFLLALRDRARRCACRALAFKLCTAGESSLK